MDYELTLRWLGSVAILVGYMNNIITGWRALPHGADYPELPSGARRRALYYGVMMFFLRVNWLRDRPHEHQRQALAAIALNIAYWSVPASFLGGAAHLFWFTQGAWTDQVGLWKFVANHVSMSIVVNFMHAMIILFSSTTYRKLSEADDENSSLSR
jgi:Na+/melibiose symporter-like transporter